MHRRPLLLQARCYGSSATAPNHPLMIGLIDQSDAERYGLQGLIIIINRWLGLLRMSHNSASPE
jgi:hypothetical protein